MENICRVKFEQRVSKSRHAVACASVLIHGGRARRAEGTVFFSSSFCAAQQETESLIKNGKSGDRRKKSFAYLSAAAARLSAACHPVNTPGDVAAIMGPPARPRAP